MYLINLEQGSDCWKKFRQHHINATDVRSILGICPFKGSPLKVWEHKCLGIEQPFFSLAAERGTLLEPSSRAWIEDKLGMEFPPAVVESSDYSWAAASLDGLNQEHRIVLELKCGGAKLHEQVLEGKIPDYYFSQVQWQLFCTGYDKAIFVSFMGLDGHYIEVARDQAYIDHVFKACEKFWKKHVLQFEAPEPGPNDWVEIDNEQWSYAAKVYKEAYEAKRQAENQLEAAKAKFESLAKGIQRAKGSGISFYRTTSKGTVDYKAFIEAKGLTEELKSTEDQYRKAPSKKVNVRINEIC